MELNRSEEGVGPRVVLVHGFTQTLRSWRQVADRLTADHRVVSVDLPGHGGSGELRGDLTTTAAALGTAGGRATYVGYSMGGRVVLRLALDRPDLVERMVLIGATAGIDSPSDRKARRVADERLASAIEQDGVPRFLVRWLSQPIFAGLSVNEEDRQARLTNSAPGLAASLRDSGTGTMDPPWWDELRRIRCPTRIVAGERDAKFTDLGRRMAGLIADADLVVVAGVGHAAQLEAPEAVAELVRDFMRYRSGEAPS
ncbi:MAG: alpha/beta fold hydrolase [Acidimicrobiales bacterium]|nr:alpha/beta fold hydrolase [Acidimicrobiales bacterium]